MIYAFIIIIALAIAFIILMRRLPQAIELAKQELPAVTPSKAPASFRMPQLPKLPSFARTVTETTQDKPTTRAVVKPSFKLPQFSFPKFNLPKRQPRPTVTPPRSALPEESTRKPHEFWADLGQAKPVSEAMPTTESAPETNRSFRPKMKNLNQEADDLFAIKDYRKAEKLYLKLAADDPTSPKIYSRLGIIYLEQKNYEDARDAFQQAIKFEPGIASRHFNLAISYLNLGSPAKAMHSLEQALKHDPANRKYRKMLDDVKSGRA